MHLRFVFKFPFIAAVMGAAASVSLGACGGTDPVGDDVVSAGEAEELTAESAEALTCPASVPTIDMRKSLFVTKETDPNVMLEFTLSSVLQQLITSVGSDQTPLSLYQRWWDTQNDDSHSFFGDPDTLHCDDVTDSNGNALLNGFPYACPRNEGVLAGTNPFNPAGDHFMEPVALVNRFDLTPDDGSHCGEYRIVYAKKSSGTFDRNFIIFEAQLPNPNPECGVAACLPVAEFWASLSTMTETQRSVALEGFYYNGLPGFAPVFQASNFMDGTGQIRTNQFMSNARSAFAGQPWTLREFKLDVGTDFLDNSVRLFVKPVTVKENPFVELFSSSFNPSDPRGAAFESDFLAALDGLVPLGSDENNISLATLPNPEDYNSGESIANGSSSNDYRARLAGNTAFIADIDTALAPILVNRSIPGMVTAEEAAARATTQSCAGCHQLSSNESRSAALIADDVGGLHVWPGHSTASNKPNAFVHVNELGQISDPLQFTFLPHRAQVLTNFIEEKSCEEACSSTAARAVSTSASADASLDGAEPVRTLGGSSTH
ncbi:hypothetical protein [Sorangium sp. So ce1099]|uniref:hypothetical protein n=1 Tax=Sorangium sp. So ce1099 TaxID=3133331 RepID=UPI003F5F9428